MNKFTANSFLRLSFVFILSLGLFGCASGQSVDRKHTIESWNGLKWKNIVRQGYDYSCGAAALATLAKGYFNDPIDEALALQVLLSEVPSPAEVADRVENGFSMLDLQKTAHHFGYESVGVKLPPDAIFKLKGPVIVILTDDEIEHFVVLKGADEEKVYLADSFRGNTRMSLKTFFEQWSGTALILGQNDTELRKSHFLTVMPNEKGSAEISAIRAFRASLLSKTNQKSSLIFFKALK